MMCNGANKRVGVCVIWVDGNGCSNVFLGSGIVEMGK